MTTHLQVNSAGNEVAVARRIGVDVAERRRPRELPRAIATVAAALVVRAAAAAAPLERRDAVVVVVRDDDLDVVELGTERAERALEELRDVATVVLAAR